MTYAPSGAKRNVTNWFATEVPKIGLSITNSVSKLSVHDHCACLYYPSLHLALFYQKHTFSRIIMSKMCNVRTCISYFVL